MEKGDAKHWQKMDQSSEAAVSMGEESPRRSAEGDAAKADVAKRLEAVGLSAEYWLPKLHTQLGVTSAQALKHLRSEDYVKLERDIRHEWEKQALQELCSTDSKARMQQLKGEHKEMLKKSQELRKLTLQEIKPMQEKAVKKKEGVLRRRMNVTPEYWAPSQKSLGEVMGNAHKQLDLPEQSVSQSETLPDREVVRRASGGLALQGIYKSKQLAEMVEKREQLLEVPDGLELFGPQQGPLCETKEFSSAAAECTFTRTMETLGYSLSLTATGGFGEFSVDTTTDCSSSSESEGTHRSRSERTYLCTTKYSYIPLASCYFPKDRLRLSSAALQELKEIELLLSHAPEPDKLPLLKSRAGNFFKRFGSHVNQGPLHLGGIFWWKAGSQGFRAEQLDEVKKRASDELRSYVGGSYSGFGGGIAAGVTASKSGAEASFQGTGRKQTQVEIQLCVTKTGGPPAVDSLAAWKSGLLASNKTWSVIDRGSQLTPVWDLILANHRQDFKDVYQMGSSLTRAYEALTNLSASPLAGAGTVSALDEARSFLEEMKTWEVTGEEGQLVTLLKFKQKLNEKTRSPSMWIDICLSDKVLQDFLEHTVSRFRESPVPNEKYIRSVLYYLLNPDIYLVQNFPKSSFIMQWIFPSAAEQADQSSSPSSEITDFTKVLQQMESDLRDVTSASLNSPAAEHEAKRKATLTLSLSIHSLLQALRERAETDIELLLLSLVASTGYRVDSHTFQYLLGCSEINFLLKEMKTAYGTYLTLRDQSVSRAQAFLLLTGLTVAAKNQVMAPEEKKKHLNFIKDHIGNSLSEEVTFVLTKHRVLTDWKALERDLNSLVNGTFEATNDDQQKEYIRKELENVFQESKLVNSAVSTCEEVQPTGTKTKKFPQTAGFQKLIKRLNLESYYPNKMGMADFQKIRKTSLNDHYPSNESELPFYFLDKLLMLDYRARSFIYKNDSKTEQGMAKTANTSDDVNEPSDDLDELFNDDDESNEFPESNEDQVHPMDVQMAIFLCADDFMRQYISTKLALCQFALPLLVPDPHSPQIELPLWSFCQVNKKWQSRQESQKKAGVRKCENKLIYQAHVPVVSFMRFGESSFSKSQLLNTLLSKQKHNIFFHRHCRGSIKNCLLMEGVVEITWYCPGGKDDDSFENCIAFTNLHGDAREHTRQVKFLQEIASVSVVLLSEADQNEKGKKVLKDLLKSPKPVIFLCTDKERTPVNKTRNRVKIAVKNQNEARLMDALTTAIKNAIEILNISCSLGKCANIAREHGFHIDEDKRECKEGKELAQKVIGFLKQKDILDVKDELLPLQGKLWHEWCKTDKKHAHLQDNENMSIEQQRSQIKSEKHAIRKDQLQKAFPLKELMRSVLSALNLPSHKTKIYFLQWLQIFIADLSSDFLPEHHQKYHELWSQNQRSKNNDLQKQLEELSRKINASTFGLEHLLREVGQIYEALDALPRQDACHLKLPQVAADLIVSGYPIELLDGDTSCVPLKWIGAIFDKLIEKLGDKKVFVLSVLGIQSTGKSTLLNAMFGLQFKVSAGKCTRGAFMQLVKVDDELREELNFDFVVVIDTEGLRAIELENRSALSHDNELATFVIGLGNTTMINIFGENPSEMQDILQIAVQAFLRMKQVKLSPSCLFVHQNVGDITAKEQNMGGRRCLQEKLDEMAIIAAQQESCDVTCFSDVIRFDVNTHIHYFPHLWEGDPPMAPPNPSYSQSVQELKRKILVTAMEKSEHRFLSLSDLKKRIQDLWAALLNENFVFSFKNTLEIEVYTRLENNYSKWTWELRRFMLGLQNKLNIQIQNGKVSKIDSADIENRVQEKYDATEKDLESYFSEDKYSDILIQWKANIKRRMNFFRQDLIDSICRRGQEQIDLKNRQNSFEQKKSTYKDELLRKSKELARDFRDKELSESELRTRFIPMWNKWITDVSSAAHRVDEPNIHLDMETFLLGHFKSEHDIRNRIATSSEWTDFPLDFSEHGTKSWNLLKKTDKSDVQKMKDSLKEHICEYIESKAREIMNYSSSYFHEIVDLISKKLESDSKKVNFTLTPSDKVDISLYFCQMATRKFRETLKAFQESNNPALYLESKREEFFSSFKIACQGATSTATFADILCSNLKFAIRDAVYDKTALDIANEMKSNHEAFNGNRRKLETFMLHDLLVQEDFERYQEYIYNPGYCMEGFIRRAVDSYCLDKKNPKLKKFLDSNLDSFQALVLSAVHESTNVVKDKHGNVALWLDEFCTRLGDDLCLPRSNLQSIEHQEITDIQFLKEVVSESLIPVLEQLKQTFSETDLDPFVAKPHEILFEQFRGCLKQCPFCKAVCTNTIPGHDGDHSTDFHHPQAMTGIQWEGTNHLVTDICSSLAGSDSKIVLGEKTIPFKKYREIGPDYANWNIKPDTSQMSYWKWFVSHFRSDLEKAHNGKFEGKGAIPRGWENIDKRDAAKHILILMLSGLDDKYLEFKRNYAVKGI